VAPQREWFEQDYYAVLGVGKTATEKEITRAYRQLAKQFHPDANPGDTAAEERFKELGEAYEALNDPQKRAAYDQFGHAARHGEANAQSGESALHRVVALVKGFEDRIDLADARTALAETKKKGAKSLDVILKDLGL